MKGDLWTVYKETCEKHGEKAENNIPGVCTQTDFSIVECDCKKSQTLINLKSEQCDEDKDNKEGMLPL